MSEAVDACRKINLPLKDVSRVDPKMSQLSGQAAIDAATKHGKELGKGQLLFGREHVHVAWKLVPSSTPEHATSGLFIGSASLLEKELHIIPPALCLDVINPSGLHRARSWPRLTPDNGPMNVLEVHLANGGQ